MDFKDTITQLAERIRKQKESVATEEATKNAFILPMISALGYDVFDPTEVVPEMDCDMARKKGEKIDYAVVNAGEPIMLIECKHCTENLDLHSTQLQRYFSSSTARFGVLTNGIEYRFYTDLEKPNLMDEKPFLAVNMLDLSEEDIEQLKKFHKSYFDKEKILSTAKELKYMTAVKAILSAEFSEPSGDFVKFVARQVYDGALFEKAVNMFTPIVKKAINDIIQDTISVRLNKAMNDNGDENEESAPSQNETPASAKDVNLPDGVVSEDKEKGVVTTQEEIDAYLIVKAILCKVVDASRVVYKDRVEHFNILIDGNKYKWVCKLYLNHKSAKYIDWMEDDNTRSHTKIDTINDLYKYEDKLRHIAQRLTQTND